MVIRIKQDNRDLVVNFTPNPVIPGVRLNSIKERCTRNRIRNVTTEYKGTSIGAQLAFKITNFIQHEPSAKRYRKDPGRRSRVSNAEKL